MEKYLGEKGFYPQAINHAKKLFDDIADKENRIKNQKRDSRINTFERKLLTERTNDVVITIQFNKFSCNKSKFLVEKDVEKLIDYFHAHNNENVFCNIIMENDSYWHHKEVWHIKEPISENAKKYYDDVYDKIIINNYIISTNDESNEPNWAPKLIPQEVLENKGKYTRYGMSYWEEGEYDEAINCFKNVLDIDPEFTTALLKTAHCLMNLGRYEEAITYLERLKYPYDREFAPLIEECRIKLKESESSGRDNEDENIKPKSSNNSSNTEDLDEINRSHKSSFYYYNLGFQYKSSSQKERAVKYFKKALEIDPKFSTALEQLGYTLEELGRYDEAIEYLERVDYDYGDVSRHISDCYRKLEESPIPSEDYEDCDSDSQNHIDKYENNSSSKDLDSRSNDSTSDPIIIELDNEEIVNELNTDVHEDYNEIDYLSKIKQAKELLDDGAITQEEYNILKRKFLDLI